MGRKIFQISEDTLVSLFGPASTIGPYTVANDPIPEDAAIIDCRFNGFAGSIIEVLIESASFPDHTPGEHLPVLNTIITRSEERQ